MGAALCTNGIKIVQDTTVSTKLQKQNTQAINRDEDIQDKDNVSFNKRVANREHEKLWSAVESNDQVAAEKYLDFNDINENDLYDPYGQTMLHMAAGLGYAEMLMVLIERTGAKPDLVNASLATPLHLACRNNRETIVKFLIGCGVDVNIQDEHGQTPLLICCIHGHNDILSMLVEASIAGHLAEPLEIDLANHQGLTPLNCAAIKGDFEMVKCLVSRGNAEINQTSPKGCTPLIYAGRGGYSSVVEFLIEKKASPLKQDNAGGTVLHHAIEKGHINVLETMISLGVDVYSAIEIADNAGRTPLFEAVENLNYTDIAAQIQIIQILTRSKSKNGFQASPNVVNYNGQTPLFIAARQGCLEAVKALIEVGAKPDLNNGELVKPEDDKEIDGESESLQEKYFMDAFKNCMTPLHVSAVLGYDDIVLYLANDCGADVNLQSKGKGLSALHLCVLSNKPEMIIDLLIKTGANPLIEDRQGRTLLDMVYQYIPSYVETFQNILETLQIKSADAVIPHYQDDERQITGVKTKEEINEMYVKEVDMQQQEENYYKSISMDGYSENELLTEGVGAADPRIEKAFGVKVALCLASQNWQYKEQAMKYALRLTEKYLTRSEVSAQTINTSLVEMIDGSLAAVGLTCRDKVIKVFNTSLQLFNMVIQSSRIERDLVAAARLLKSLKEEQLIYKFLLQSEQSNTRVTNKIHEALLDLSYQAHLGEDIVTNSVYEQIQRLTGSQNHKGLLAHLALLFKLVNSFNVHKTTHRDDSSDEEGRALTWYLILEVVLPQVNHTKDDIRNAAVKILIDVQKKTGLITLSDLDELPDKIKESVWEKISEAVITNDAQQLNQIKKVNIVNLEIPDNLNQDISASGKLNYQALEKFKQIISEKGSHKDWMQREIALNALQECFNLNVKDCIENEDQFLAQCSILLQTSLDENNIQIYLIAVEVVLQFILKVSTTEAVLDALPTLLQSVILRTTDTNTRVRKRSVEVISQVWDIQLNKKSSQSASQIVANILCDASLNEKAIIGRLGLFIKKAILIENSQDISKKPLQLILGKDYEQLAQFACQWCLHKNTKVRQCALKLAIEICRLNSIDPKGLPFKQRIVNYILGLRSSIRDPLVKKINEVCQLANPSQPQYINESEIELGLPIKNAARGNSLDIRKVKQQNQVGNETLPSISGAESSSLPSVVPQISGICPTIVLPHSEPLSAQQKEQASQLIELFGQQLVTCFYSQTWSSRLIAIQKVDEQLHNLDPNRRDAMSAEINKNNLPPEITFKSLLKFFEEGLKDPVLKNYITILDLIQTALPIYFLYLRPEQIKRELIPLIQVIISKTSDLKQKVREASINFCLYLSHQNTIGPDSMVALVLGELDPLQWEKLEAKKDVTNSFCNSNMIVSCLNMLAQLQLQTNIVTQTSKYHSPYANYINKALRHTNPQVRKEGEALFKIMYNTYGDVYIKELKDQKPQLVTKLIADAKTESLAKAKTSGSTSDTQAVQGQNQEEISKEQVQVLMLDDYLNQPSIQSLMKGNEEKFNQLKLPNPKKRQIAIVEIKKAIQQKLTQLNANSARDLVEPLSLLLRHLLRDDNVDVYLESLNLLKFVVGNLAQHLSALDLHLMMGQFIGVVVSGKNANIRIRVASDKVIVYFAKHNNIGSLVVAKEVLKNIERLNKSAMVKPLPNAPVDEIQEEKKQNLSRFYSLLQMLLQQFSIVLCYQPDFYSKCLDLLSETMSKCAEEPILKSTCTQLVVTLHQIDQKLLDQGVQQLDFTKKTHLKKIIIELQNSSEKGLVSQNQNLLSNPTGSNRPSGSPNVSFRDTQQSFTSLNSRNTLMSPGLNMNRRLSRDQKNTADNRTSKENHPAATTRDINQTIGADQWPRIRPDQNQTGIGWLEKKQSEASSALPLIDGSGTTRRRQIGQGFVGGSSNKAAGFNRNDFNLTGDYSNNKRGILGVADITIGTANGVGSNLLNAPKKIDKDDKTEKNNAPLYVPTQRTSLIKKQDGYQPTILQRLNSKEVAQPQKTDNEISSRPLIGKINGPSFGAGSTTNSFGTNQMMGSTTSTVGSRLIMPPPAAIVEIKRPSMEQQQNNVQIVGSRHQLY